MNATPSTADHAPRPLPLHQLLCASAPAVSEFRRSHTIQHFHLPPHRLNHEAINVTSSKSTLCLNFGLSPMARSPVNASTSLQQQKRRAEIRLFECVKSRQIGERLENTVGELDAIIAQIDTQMRQQSDNNADTSSSRGPQSLPWISVVDAFAEELQRRVDMTNRNRNNIALNKLDTTTERTRVERLCDELNDQLSRRHGYIPNSGPSLQNKMERLDALLQEFSYNADTLPSSSANGATRAFSVQPQSQTPVMKRDLGRSRSSSSHSVRAWKSAAVRTCTALFDFVPQSAKEIAFRHGDVLRIHRQVDANWLEGERDGRIGVFPINYVQLNDKKHGHVTLRALFKFTPINANEMPLSQGEIVERIRNIDPYWIEGRNRCGRVGIFPRSYVAFVQNDGDEVVSSDTLSPPTRPKTPMLRDGLPASSLSLSTSSSSYFENNDIWEQLGKSIIDSFPATLSPIELLRKRRSTKINNDLQHYYNNNANKKIKSFKSSTFYGLRTRSQTESLLWQLFVDNLSTIVFESFCWSVSKDFTTTPLATILEVSGDATRCFAHKFGAATTVAAVAGSSFSKNGHDYSVRRMANVLRDPLRRNGSNNALTHNNDTVVGDEDVLVTDGVIGDCNVEGTSHNASPRATIFRRFFAKFVNFHRLSSTTVESRPAATPRIYTKSPFHSTAPTTLQSAVAPLYANRSRSAGNLNFGRRVAASAATTVPWSEDASTSTTTPSLSLASIPNVSLADKTKTPTAKSASARRHSPSTDSLVARILADCPTTASSTSVTRRPLASSLRDTQPKREYRGRSVGTVDDVESASSFAKVFHKTVQRRLVPSINLEKYRSLYAYDPQHDDELKLLEGDVIHVVRKCDDGWFIGTQERTGQFGTFPGNYVTRV